MNRAVVARIALTACGVSVGALLMAAGQKEEADPFAPHDIPQILSVATDPTYGYTEKNPVKVGFPFPKNEHIYLSRLKGPGRVPIHYERLGSCCEFKTRHAFVGDIGLLDKYEVTYEGAKKPLVLYVNGYDYETPKVPVGLSQ